MTSKDQKLTFENIYERGKELAHKVYGNYSFIEWAILYGEVKKIDPNATYKYIRKEDGSSVWGDELIGYSVRVEATFLEETFEEELPILDHRNLPIKANPYEIQYGKNKVTVEGLSSDNVNKARKRCMVKAFAHFGLGLHNWINEGDILASKPILEQERFDNLCKLDIDVILVHRHRYHLSDEQERILDEVILKHTKKVKEEKGQNAIQEAIKKTKEK
jgi:hypothetical protein